MARNELVTVENIKNPAVKRQMTVASAKMNSRKWRIIDQEIATEVKKKVVVPVAAKPSKSVIEAHDDLASTPTGFAKVESEKETLQAEYEAKAGKKPDGRWNEAKLREKIAELKANDDEAA